MKAGLTTSVVMHAALLGFGLISLSAPAPMDVADVEALPVDIVPVEELTQIQQGEKKAPVSEKPAPMPTKRPDTVPDAQKVGDNDVDTDNPITPDEKINPVKTAEAKAPAPKPVEKPKLEETPKVKEEPKAGSGNGSCARSCSEGRSKTRACQAGRTEAGTSEAAGSEACRKAPGNGAAAEPVKPDAVSEAIRKRRRRPRRKAPPLPDSAPAPQARPKPAEAQTAKGPGAQIGGEAGERGIVQAPVGRDRLDRGSGHSAAQQGEVERRRREAVHAGSSSRRQEDNGREAVARRDGRTARPIEQLLGIPVGMEDGSGLRVSIRFNVDTSGKVEGAPQIDSSSGNTIFDESALRAVRKCDQQGLNLPAQKSDIWSEIVVNFDPSEMF